MMTLALIGVGWWGKHYLETVKRIPNCQIKYVCARTSKSLVAFKKEYVTITGFRKLFAYSDIAGVIIATPPGTHASIAVEFLKRNYNVLVEKPVATEYKQALTLQKLANKSKGIFMPAYVFLYHPAFKKMLEYLSEIGKILYVMSEGADYGPIRSDVTPLWDWGSHDLSMCLAIFRVKPVSVAAWNSGRQQMNFLRLLFPNGVAAFITVGSLAPIKSRRLTVLGAHGALIFDDTVTQKLLLIKNLTAKPSLPRSLKTIIYPEYERALPLDQEFKEFIAAIKQKEFQANNFLAITSILTAAEKSMRNNGKVVKLI